jgi:hypothetical protein
VSDAHPERIVSRARRRCVNVIVDCAFYSPYAEAFGQGTPVGNRVSSLAVSATSGVNMRRDA